MGTCVAHEGSHVVSYAWVPALVWIVALRAEAFVVIAQNYEFTLRIDFYESDGLLLFAELLTK